MKQLILSSVVAVALAFLPAAAAAAGDGHRQHGVHQHGEGSLNVVVEGTELYLEFGSPAADIAGFEHRPRTAAQKAVLEEALILLRDGGRLFKPAAAAGCRLVEAAAATDLLATAKDGHDHARKSDDHRRHQSGASGSHDHDHEHHADFEASYRFSCTQPEGLDRLEVGVFEFFPSLQRVRVQAVTDQGQKGAILDSGNRSLRL